MLKPGDNLTVSEIVDGHALLYDDSGNKFWIDLYSDDEDGEATAEMATSCDHPGCGRESTRSSSRWHNSDHMTVDYWCDEHAPQWSEPIDDVEDDEESELPSSHVKGCAARYGGPCTAGCPDTGEEDADD